MKYFNERIQYDDLKGKQQEIYNFQKVSAHLADYGYTTIKLDDDWMGADFIAILYILVMMTHHSWVLTHLRSR